MKLKVIAVKENQFDDKYNPGQKTQLNKVTVLLDDGVGELWTSKPVHKDDEVVVSLKQGDKLKPAVKIVDVIPKMK